MKGGTSFVRRLNNTTIKSFFHKKNSVGRGLVSGEAGRGGKWVGGLLAGFFF